MADDDPRLLHWCRMGLLTGALLHWLVIGVLLWHKTNPALHAIQFSNLG